MNRIIEVETNKYAKRFYQNLVKEGYKLIGDNRYVKARLGVLVRCPNGHERSMIPFTFNKGHLCKVCSDVRVNKAERDKYFELFKSTSESEGYTLTRVENYKDSQTPTGIKHLKCGHEYTVRPVDYLRVGTRCPKCFGMEKRTTKGFALELYREVGNDYEVVNDYEGANKHIRIRHNSVYCNYFEFEARASSVLNGISRCPKCRNHASKGELEVERVLTKRKTAYKTQVRFPGCRNSYTLPFDFAIKDGKEVLCLIEYQGIQHYEVVPFFRGEEGFKITKKNDAIKRRYCQDVGIPLIEIPYWDIDNIEKILDEELSTQT